MAEASDVLASDAEREAAVAQLREEAATGRLDTAEFERRIDLAYRAQTRGELARLAADLPAPAPPALPVASPWRSEAMRRQAVGFVIVNVVAIAVWLATGANGGFWPIWVLLVSGIGLFAVVVRTAFGVEQTARPRRLERGERVRRRRR